MPLFSATTIPAALDHGLNLFKSNQFPAAEKVYEEILEQAPGHPEALYMLGILAFNQSRVDEACRLLAEADGRHPAPLDHHRLNFAIALAAADRHEEAVSVFKRALAHNPNLYRAHGYLGYSLLKIGRLQEAAASVNQAIRINPDYGDSYFFLGSVLLAAQHPAEALVAFREAQRLGPESPSIAILLGNAFNQLGCGLEALACYRAALSSALLKPTAGDMRRESNAILRRLCAPLTGRVYSIGSGNDLDKEGRLYREYFPACTAYLRIDFDNRNYPDILGDAQNLRGIVPDHAGDVVFSIWALEHIPDVPAALAEIRRILRPGGVFVFGLPLNMEFHSFPHDYHRFTLDGIRQLFSGIFHIEEVYPIGKETPLLQDRRLTLFGARPATAPASYVGRCRAI